MYMTDDFAKLQTRRFGVYYIDKQQLDERARQQQEHLVRVANKKKRTKRA